MSDDERLDLLTLQLTPGIGPVRLSALLERFGSPAAILRADLSALGQVEGIGPRIAQALRDSTAREQARRELQRAVQAGITLRARGEVGYPPMLAEIPGSPALLFLSGTWLEQDAQAVALVGTRHPNSYGRRVATLLATELARRGYVVVSGMARGIDGIAHLAALEAGGRTLAVLAGGFDHLYPPEHRPLAQRIARQGALLSESVPSQEPLKGLFPARNRLISGLARAVVIVQAAEGSGALITATHAAEQGRPVLAVPGPVDEQPHTGCHRLLREGATLCRGVDDILEEMHGLQSQATGQSPPQSQPLPPPSLVRPWPAAPPVPAAPASMASVARPSPPLSQEEQLVRAALRETIRSMDELVRETTLPVPQLSSILMTLQMRRLVRQLPGNRYSWCVED
ncbi:MAG: DNA-processing protein DprA [Gemmataceae bacterium]